MPRRYPAPTRSLPTSPSLTQLRKQAKELFKSVQAGEADTLTEVAQFERNFDPSSFALADAQRVLARAYGFASWTRLMQHVAGVNVNAFCEAADAGDVAKVLQLAEARPALINTAGGGKFGGITALHVAVLQRHAEMTRALMELGSDARTGIWPHRDASSAHTIASERGYDEIVAIIENEEERRRQQLSAPGATISAQTDDILQAIRDDRCDEAIAILASNLTLVGASDVRGATPLHAAARAHQPQLVAWLLDRQAPVDALDAESKSPLDDAALVAGWSSCGRTFGFLENAQCEPARFYDTVRLLRSQGAQLTPPAAVAMGDKQAILQMHREGRLKNEVHFYRGGLLSIAVRVYRPDIVSLLLDLGLDPDEAAVPQDDGSRSWGMPLWFAAVCGRHEIAELLLARGADVNAIVYACGDALSIAETRGDEEMKTLLLTHGARVTVEHVAGYRDRETARAILAGKISAQSLNIRDPSPTDLAEQMLWAAGSCDPEIVRMCLPHMKRERDDPWWNYVLMHATLPESFRLVLEHGVDPNVCGEGGYTALHHLATVAAHERPGRRQISEQQRLLLATMLLDAGASFQRRDPLLGSTPLGWSCRWGRVELVRLYLDRGADAGEAEAEPWATPLAWATKGGHTSIIELLRARGAT